MSKNPLWLLESNYLQIKTKAAGIFPLILNFAQTKLNNIIKELQREKKPVRIVILKARQEGISTDTDAILYAYTSQQEGINSLIIADDVDGSNYLLDIIKLYQERLPEHLKPRERKSNEKKLEFDEIHSQILVDTANNPNAGRKYTYRYVHISELGYFNPNKVDEVMGGLLQTVPKVPNSIIIAESTANGVGNYYYDLWTKAEKGENDWYPLFIAWFEHSEYAMVCPEDFKVIAKEEKYKEEVLVNTSYELTNEQLYWRRQIIRNDLKGDEKKFNQEYPAYPAHAFLVSGRPRFDIDTLIQLKANAKKPYKCDGKWEIFEEPKENRPYIIGADTAENTEKSCNSIAQILDPIDFKVVAKYRGKIEPELFGHELIIWGRKYNNAHICIEANNHGLTTLTVIKNENYSNIYYRKFYDKVSDEWTERIGWLTTSKTKVYMIDHLAIALLDGLDVHSIETIDEHITFVVNDNGTCSAQVGKKDDEVMALAIANQAFLEGYWKEKQEPQKKIEKGSVAYEMEQEEREAKDWRGKYQ